jgi:hypothetical protein
MAALTFNTRYDYKNRKRKATGDSATPAPAAKPSRLVTIVLIAVAAVIGYKLIKKSS